MATGWLGVSARNPTAFVGRVLATAIMLATATQTGGHPIGFDTTSGYPGEGPSETPAAEDAEEQS